MSISIVITTHRRPDLLKRNLESLAGMSDRQCLGEVIVIENGSAEAQAVCEAFSRQLPLRYLHRAEAGKGRALQWYLQQVNTGLLLFLDDDVRVSPGFVRQYDCASRAHGPGSYFGGELRADFEAQPESWLRPYLPPSATGWDAAYLERARRGEAFFSGANYAVYVSDLKAVGGFRCDIGPGAVRDGTEGNPTGHEWELQYRLRDAGMRAVFVGDAPVWHYVPRSNCTPDWALHRIYRNAYFATLRAQADAHRDDDKDDSVSVLKRRYLKQRLYALAATLVRDREKRFHMRRRLFEIRGRLEGFRHVGKSGSSGR